MASTTLRLRAYYTTEYDKIAGIPMGYEFNAELPTVEDAKAFVAQFPKSAKMFAVAISGVTGIRGWVAAHGNLVSNDVNHGINETGLKRYRTILKAASKLGIEIEYKKDSANSYSSRETFEQAINQEVNA
jgi:hypothetical protein